jgi:hypothetical protein
MTLSRSQLYDGLIAQGVSPEVAARELARRFGTEPVAELPSQALARQSRLEKIEQRDIQKLWLQLQADWFCTSVGGRAKITPGYPDLWLALPEWGVALFWETKAVGYAPTPEQYRFLDGARRGGTLTGAGTFFDFHRYLRLIPQVAQSVERTAVVSIALDRASLSLDPAASIWRELPAYLVDPSAMP